MDNNILQAPLLDKEKQEQQKKSLEMLDRSVQADHVKALSGEDVYRIEKEESGVVQLRRTLGINLDEYNATLLGKQPATFYERDVTRYEKQKKKKGEQERDANARAKQKGLIYASDQQAALQQDVLAHLQHAKEDVLPPNYRISGTALAGEELTPDPETGAVDITGLLEKRRRLQHQSKMFKAAKKRGEKINLSTQCGLETNEQALAVLDDAVRTYYAANGIDCDTGKSVSTRKQRNAQQHLALAMENYRELAGNLQDMPGSIMLDHIKENPQYRQELEKLKNPDAKLDTTDDYASGLSEIRQLIAENSEKYGSNKEIVDKLYREYLACAKRGGELYREAMATNRMLGSNRDDIQRKAADITERNALPLKLHAAHIHEAMQYLLKGKDPTDEGDLLFIENHCGIVTKNREALKEKEAAAAKIPSIQLRRSKDDPEAEELALKYGKIRLEFIDSYLKAKAQYDANPEDELSKSIFTTLADFLTTGSSNVLNMQQHTFRMNEGDFKRTLDSRSAKWTSPKGVEIIFDATTVGGGAYRDMALNVMPLGHASEMTKEQLGDACDSFHVLAAHSHLKGEPATEEEINGAFDNELKVQRDAYADIQQLITEHPQKADASGLQPHELLDIYPDCSKLHNKSQELTGRVVILVKHPKFIGLSEEDQKEIKEMYRFFGGVRDYAREIQRIIMGQQRYMQGESDTEERLQSTLDSAGNDFYRRNEKNLSEAIAQNRQQQAKQQQAKQQQAG